MMTIPETAAWLRDHDNYTILTHRRPDGDTVGCAVALCLGLKQLGKQAEIYENVQFTEMYQPRLAGLTAKTVSETVVAVDLASPGLFPMGFDGPVDLCIDHHGSNEFYAGHTYVEGDRATCGEVIFDILLAMGVQIDVPIAEALYIAVSTDTGCFRYSNTTAGTHRTVAALMECGADVYSINRMVFETKTKARYQLESYLTAGMKLYADGKIGICALPEAERIRMNATEDDCADISNFPRNMEGVVIGVMLRELPNDHCKISLRADDRLYNASDICQVFGGGGHSAAAGATVSGSLEDGRREILRAIAQVTGLQVDA